MDIVERLQGMSMLEASTWVYADKSKRLDNIYSDAADEIERLRGVLLTVLEACKDVNSPDRKVREEIARTVNKALKEKT